MSVCVLCGSPVWPSPPVVGPLWGPPLCVGPLFGSPVWVSWVPSVWIPCVGPLCGSPVWVPRPTLCVMWHLLTWCLPLVHTLPLYLYMDVITWPRLGSSRILAFTRYCFTQKLYCWSPSSCSCPPPTCKAYPIAILLHDHCAIYAPPPTSPFYAIYHTIFLMTISCKSQLVSYWIIRGIRIKIYYRPETNQSARVKLDSRFLVRYLYI